jgi:hypothetical protein
MRIKAKPTPPKRKEITKYIATRSDFTLDELNDLLPATVHPKDVKIHSMGHEDEDLYYASEIEVFYLEQEDIEKFEKRFDQYKVRFAAWEKWRDENKEDIEEIMRLRAEKTLSTAQIRLDKEKKKLEKDIKELENRKKKLGLTS